MQHQVPRGTAGGIGVPRARQPEHRSVRHPRWQTNRHTVVTGRHNDRTYRSRRGLGRVQLDCDLIDCDLIDCDRDLIGREVAGRALIDRRQPAWLRVA